MAFIEAETFCTKWRLIIKIEFLKTAYKPQAARTKVEILKITIAVLIHVFRIGYFGLVCFDTNFETFF